VIDSTDALIMIESVGLGLIFTISPVKIRKELKLPSESKEKSVCE